MILFSWNVLNTLSYYLKKNPQVVTRFDDYVETHGYVFISRITVVEILGGLRTRNAVRQIESFKRLIADHKILDTTELSAEISADIFAELYKKGRHSGNYDILIAAIAMANDLTLVTNNTKDYNQISGLLLDNWTLKVD
jgi:tRNA(fMet)-specific endonuclease VapC